MIQGFENLPFRDQFDLKEKVDREFRNHRNSVVSLNWLRFVYLCMLCRIASIPFDLPVGKKKKVGNGRGVYLVEAEGLNRYKIGWSENPRNRLRALQIGSPVKLILLSVIKAEKVDEALMHSLFAPGHVHGEWFCLPDHVVNFLQSLKQSTA